jgi:hypothetical protein
VLGLLSGVTYSDSLLAFVLGNVFRESIFTLSIQLSTLGQGTVI